MIRKGDGGSAGAEAPVTSTAPFESRLKREKYTVKRGDFGQLVLNVFELPKIIEKCEKFKMTSTIV